MNLKRAMQAAVLGAVGVFAVGCGGVERTEVEWQDDTQKIFQKHAASVKGCYEQALQETPDLKGRLIVKYNVADRNGKIKSVKFDGNSTVSNAKLEKCVERILERASYSPGDVNNAKATVVIDFNSTIVDEETKPGT